MIKINLRSKYNLTLIALLFLSFLALSALLFLPSLDIKDKAGFLLRNKISFEKSFAQITLQEQTLKINFDINPKDQDKVNTFSKNLGVGVNWQKGVELTLGKEEAEKIAPTLPLKVSLGFESKKLSLRSSSLPDLKSAINTKNYELATNSSRLSLKMANARDFKLIVVSPEGIIKHATASGDLVVAPKLERLFPISGKIARIEVRVNGKSVNGEIELK